MFITYLDDEKINRSTDLISMYDRELAVTRWNPACENKFGIAEKEILGQKLEDIFPHYPLKNDYRVVCLRDAAVNGKSFYFPNLPYRYRDGFCYQAIVPLKSREGTIIGTMNVVRDSHLVIGKISKRDLLVPLIKTSQSKLAHLFG